MPWKKVRWLAAVLLLLVFMGRVLYAQVPFDSILFSCYFEFRVVLCGLKLAMQCTSPPLRNGRLGISVVVCI